MPGQEVPFYPQGNGVALAVTDVSTATPIRVQPSTAAAPASKSSPQLMVTNKSLSVNCYLAFGDASDGNNGKTMTCTIPTATPANGILILANSTQIFSYNPNGYLAAICETGQSTTLYLYAGEGF